MDCNYPELNPVVILRLSYLEPKEEVLGVIYLRKESVERFKSSVKELLGDKFDLVELNPKSNFDEYLQKLDPITSLESDVCFMFIPFVLNSNIWEFTTPLNCIEYVIAHELTHLIEQNHTDRFRHILGTYLPGWQKIKEQLNEFPL